MKKFLPSLLLLCLFSSRAPLSAQVLINEILASNASVNADPDFNTYSDWVELYNAGATAVNLGGYFISDNPTTPDKYFIPNGVSIPAHGYLLIWLDGNSIGLHAGFKASAAGESILLSNSIGTLLDQVDYPAQTVNISYGRSSDGTGAWGFFTHPTPGASNNNSPFFDGFAEFVTHCSPAGGFFNGTQTVTIRNPSQVGTVRYTIDGAVPTESSTVYTGPIQLTETTVLKCRVFRNGKIPGPVEVNTYFIDENFNQRGFLPVVSLSDDPKYFFAPDSGLYAQNFKPDWEYPIHIEFYEPEGTLAFHHDAGFTIGGENAWELPQKPLNIHSRKQYGASKITYQIFPDNPRNQFDNITFRCSGNDWSQTLLRDNLEQHLMKPASNLDVQDYRLCIVYINGKYWGIHSIVTQQGDEYYHYKYGVAADSIDEIYNDGEVLLGDDQAYQAMVNRLNTGVSDDASFGELEKLMDVGNYTDYIQDELFCSNTSWGHNIGCWRMKNDTSRFRWEPFDFDRGFYLNNAGGVDMDFFTSTTGASWSNPAWATLWLRKMLENDQYKARFYSRFADHLYVTFNPRQVDRRVDALTAQIVKEIPYHVNRWTGTTSNYGNGIPTVAYWENEIANLHAYPRTRSSYLYTHLSSYFGLSGTIQLGLDVSNPQAGTIRVHALQVPEYPWNGLYFKQIPLRLQAEERAGFHFVRWEKSVQAELSLIAAGSSWKYHDTNNDPLTAWRDAGYDDGGWLTGNAQFGYGDGDEVTTLDFGGNSNNKIISYYFRNKFELNGPIPPGMTLRMIVDDGAIVYLNGTELLRYNMPTSNVNFSTLATASISGATETSWQSFDVPATALKSGENTLAVEVHQAAANSSDVSFDLQLSAQAATAPVFYSASPVIDLMLGDTAVAFKAIFESTGQCVLPDTIYNDMILTAACSPYIAAGNVTLKPNVHLQVEAGVEIQFPQDADFWVLGSIDVTGTENAPCKITTTAGASRWGGMLFWYPSGVSHLNHFVVDRGSAGKQRLFFPAAISVYHGTVVMDHITALTNFDNPIVGRFSDITLTNSNINLNATGDCVNVKYGKGHVEGNVFEGGTAIDADGIDYDGVTDGIIRRNIVRNFVGENNDGIDIGEQCKNLQIEENFIYNCLDKGISIGQQSEVHARNNTIARTTIGMGLKDESPVYVDHCTIYGTQKGISAYEKHAGDKGGVGTITNTIASNSSIDGFDADTTSALIISNSLSDTENAPTGANNLSLDPKIDNPDHYLFHLLPSSPCIGAASDGSEIGATYHPNYDGQPAILVSEIYYNDTQNGDDEFLEILNPGAETVYLGGFSLQNAVEYTFPNGTAIAPNERIIIANKAGNYIGGGHQVFEWSKGRLSNEGEQILLFDEHGILIDFVRYSSESPWPDTTATYGRSLELISETLDNHFHTSWIVGPAGGTPGTGTVGTHTPNAQALVQMALYPNPAVTVLNIAVQGVEENEINLVISDLQGKICRSERVNVFAGHALKQVQLNEFAAGSYVAYVLNRQGNRVGQVMFEKR
jgi:hypothetical protein